MKRNIKYILKNIPKLGVHNCRSNSLRFINSSSVCGSQETLKWSYKHGGHSEPLVGVTIGKKLQEAAEKYTDKEAHVFCQPDVRLNFQDLLEKSDELAAGLLALGVEQGDRVGIWAPNIPEWIVTQYGTARAGIILVNINPAYQIPELEYALRKVGVKAIIAAETFKTQDYYKMLHEICPELDVSTQGDLKSKRLPELKSIIMISDKDFPGAFKYTDVMSAGTHKQRSYIFDIQDQLQFDDPINIQFTSGTTGHPKGATLTHHNIMNNSKFIGERLDYHVRETRICVPVPLYHCFGMVIGSLMSLNYGSTVVYPAPSFEPNACLEAVHKERCTSLYGTPTMFIDILGSPLLKDCDLASLYTGVMGGSPCPVEIMKQTMTKLHMPDVTICYGTTENSPVTFQGYMDDSIERKTSTIGQPHPHVEAKVVDEKGAIVPVGQEGELCIRGYNVMLNYWNDPEKTREAMEVDRWYKTGDVAVMDEDGYAKIVGRMKDIIIRGGENIYPVEIENFIYKHPKVSDVQVIGLPDERLGETVCACIKVKPGEDCIEEEIKDFCKGQISHFKIPSTIVFVDEYPLTVTGKVQKYKMRSSMTEIMYKSKQKKQ